MQSAGVQASLPPPSGRDRRASVAAGPSATPPPKVSKYCVQLYVPDGEPHAHAQGIPTFTFAAVHASAGSGRALLRTIQASFESPNVSEDLLLLLELAFSDEEVQEHIVQGGGLPVLRYLATGVAAAVNNHSEHNETAGNFIEIRRRAAAVLAVAALNVKNHNRMSIVIDTFVALVRSGDLILGMHGAAGIAALSASRETRAGCTRAGAVPALLDLVPLGSDGAKLVGLQLRVAWALGNLAGAEEAQTAIMSHRDGLGTVVRLAQSGRLEAAAQAARLISNLATNPALKQPLVQTGAVEALAALAHPAPELRAVVRFVAQALSFLLSFPANRKAVAQRAGMQTFQNLAARKSPEVQLAAAHAVVALLSDPRDSISTQVREGCFTALEILQTSRDAAVQREAALGQKLLRGEGQAPEPKWGEEAQTAAADSMVVNALEGPDWAVVYVAAPDGAPPPPACAPLLLAAEEEDIYAPGLAGQAQGAATGGLLSGEEEKVPQEAYLTVQRHGHTHRKKRLGHRKLRPDGVVIFKGHPSYELMVEVQVGIRDAVGREQAKPPRAITRPFFRRVETQFFPKEGSQTTLPHSGGADFKFWDYSPTVFRQLREKFGIDAADYMNAICGNDALRELGRPGSSGSVLYISQNQRFVIKTISRDEAHFLWDFLPRYYEFVTNNPNTLLTRFFGLHKIRPHLGQNIRIVVMGSIFPTDLYLHQRFDVKGSTYKRAATELQKKNAGCTYKDLDLNFSIRLDPERREAFVRQVETDSKFLESCEIMDYSLVFGLHYPEKPVPREQAAGGGPGGVTSLASALSGGPFDAPRTLSTSSRPGALLASPGAAPASPPPAAAASPLQPASTVAMAAGTRRRLENRGSTLASAHTSLLMKGAEAGAGAEAPESPFTRDYGGMEAAVAETGEPVIIFLGLIDILQQYVVRKQMEHAYKSLVSQEGHSVIPPHQYAERFKKFVFSKFVS